MEAKGSDKMNTTFVDPIAAVEAATRKPGRKIEDRDD
jgi:hypothetical protein